MAAVGLLWAIVLLLALLVLGLMRRMTPVLERLEAHLMASAERDAVIGGAEPGSEVGHFHALDPRGATIDSSELLARESIFLFMASGCQPCRRLTEDLSQSGPVDSTPLYAVIEDSEEGRDFPVPSWTRVLYQREREVSRAFQNSATPQAFAVDRRGIVVDRVVPGSTRDMAALAHKLQEGGDVARRTSALHAVE